MKINFILPYNTWGGAFRSTYELANHLAARKEDVEIYIPFFPYLEGYKFWSLQGMEVWIRGLGRSIVRQNRLPWFQLELPLRMVPLCSNRFIRDADVVMANHWPTAYSVARLVKTKGRKFYFIRDTDPWGRQHAKEIESYRLPLTKIVVSPWLKECLERSFGVEVAGIVPNGTNMEHFRVDNKKYNAVPVICMMYVDHPAKGMSDGFNALREIKERYPEVKIILFGWGKPPMLPIDAEFHFRPVKDRLRNIYSRSDIFLSPSRQDGWNNPPLEATAAGCAVVATKVGCVPLRMIPGETAIVVEPGDVKGMVEAMCSLIENPRRIQEFGRRGCEHIQQFTWEKAATRLLDLFKAY